MFKNLSKDKKLQRAKRLFLDAVYSGREFQREAREDFSFRDGKQWTDDEKRLLQEEMRPALTFNLTKSSIDLIMGMNEDNKIKYHAVPVDPTDGFLCDVLNDIDNWIYDNNDFEEDEDGALESAAICGRGFVAIDFMPDPERFGEIELTEIHIPTAEVHLDPSTRRPNLRDSAYICWDRWITKEDFRMRYPKVSEKRLENIISHGRDWGLSQEMSVPSEIWPDEIADDRDDTDYEHEVDMTFFDKAKNLVRIVHMEYWHVYKRKYFFNPKSGQFEELILEDGVSLKDFKENFFETFGEEVAIEEVTDKKVKWLQFIGDEILYDDDSPLPYKGFSIVPVFAFRDVSLRTSMHFGLVRLMKDPQKEVNKRWSQALHMLNQQVQTGIFAETDAFVDARQAASSMKEPGSITWIQPGAIGGQKIQERSMAQFPSAPMQMEEFSQDIIKKITGINPDLLGQDRGREEPGVVIRLRQQQGITLLKPLFRNYNNAKRELFKRRLAIVSAYMPDEQITRILGENGRYQLDRETGMIVDQAQGRQASLRAVRDLEYNIKSEESPGNATKRMLELGVLLQMQQAGFPVEPNAVISKLDISDQQKREWIQYIQQREEAQMQMQREQMQQEMEFRDREIRVDEAKNSLEFIVDMAKLEASTEKDDKKLLSGIAQLESQEQMALLDFAQKMMQTISQNQVARLQKQTGGTTNNAERKKT